MVSIIVPIYNVEKYLKRCIDSILNSTFQDFELILVDDGSTDGSSAICDDYTAKDARVRTIHQTNQGLAGARNSGLDQASCDYILFVDGDDVIHPNMIQVLVDALSGGDYDFSMICGLPVYEDEYLSFLNDKKLGLSSQVRELTREDYYKGLLTPPPGHFQYNFSWNKLYRREFIGNEKFINTAIEDMEFNFRLMPKMKRAAFVETNLYYWIQRDTSLTHGGLNRRYVNRIESFKLCLDTIPRDYTDYRSIWLERLYKEMISTKYLTRHTEQKTAAKELTASVYEETLEDFWNSNLPWLKKYGFALCLNAPRVYGVFLKAFNIRDQLVRLFR